MQTGKVKECFIIVSKGFFSLLQPSDLMQTNDHIVFKDTEISSYEKSRLRQKVKYLFAFWKTITHIICKNSSLFSVTSKQPVTYT